MDFAPPSGGSLRPVALFADPMCPWSWTTAGWLREVATHGGLAVTWRFLSLRLLDDAADDPPPEHIRTVHARGHDLLGLLAAARELGGNDAVERLSLAIGRAVWERSPEPGETRPWERPLRPVDLPAALGDAGLPPSLVDRVGTRHEAIVARDTAVAVERAGPGLGSPVVAFDDGPAFFGPIIQTVPTGPAAVDAWRALEVLALTPGFHELKTTRGPVPDLPVFGGARRPR